MSTELLKLKLLEAAFNGSLTHADTSTWEFPKIGDIAFTTSGGTPQAKNKEYYESGNIRWIRSGELGVKYIYDSEIKITQKALENSSAKYYPVDSVLIALYGATVGKVAILKAESTSNQAVCAIFPNERFTPEYMYYFLSSQRDNFLGIASGGAQSNISQEKVKNSIIPLPSIAEQQRIVAALEEGFAYIDAVASAKQNLSSTAEMLRSKILQAAFDGSLTGADTSKWEETTMGDVFTHNTGKALKKDNTEGVLRPYITTSNLYWDRFDMEVVKQMYFKESELEKFTIRKGDLLICEGGDIGRSAIWDFDYEICFQNHVHRLRPRREANVRFYYYIMLYYKWTNRIKGRGIGLEGFSSGVLDKLEVPYPPIAEQQRIVAKIEELFTQIDKITK